MTRSVLDWQRDKATPAYLFAGATARERWETSPHAAPTEITEAAYDAVIASVATDRL